MKDVTVGIAYTTETIALQALLGYAECFMTYLEGKGIDTSDRKVQLSEWTNEGVSRVECTIHNVAIGLVRLIVPLACQAFEDGEVYCVRVFDCGDYQMAGREVLE